jgi:radical SAM protein with 4Fe4S-binding SPASM domain
VTQPTARPTVARADTLFWEVTNRCNLACQTCYNKPFLNDKQYTLSLDEGLERCDAIMRFGARSVIFLGGEPLADRNLLRYLEVLRSHGIECSLSTNGTLVTDSIARSLADLGVRLVSVSLDSGVPALNDLVRGSGTYDRIVTGLRTLARHVSQGLPRITIACTLARENAREYRPLFELAREVGVVDVFFNKYLKVNSSALEPSDASEFVDSLEDVCRAATSVGEFYLYLPTMPRVAEYLSARTGAHVTAKEQSCGAVDETLLLADDHKVYPCSMARVEHPEYGVSITEDIGAALDATQIHDFVKARSAMMQATPAVCAECDHRVTCATRCVLTEDQTKYYRACEVVVARQVAPA